MTILAAIKTLLEVDLSEEIFDDQLLLYLNQGIQYLINNKVPIGPIDDTSTTNDWVDLQIGDDQIIISWLHLLVLQRFDRDMKEGTRSWIDKEQENLIYQLKVKYDR